VTLHPDDIPQGADGESEILLNKPLTDVLTGETLLPNGGEIETRLPPISARLYLGK
jgi:hypothetical protein